MLTSFALALTFGQLQAVELTPMTVFIGGISCESCASLVSKSIANVPGMHNVRISPAEKSLRANVDGAKFVLQDLLKPLYGADGKYAGRLGLLAEPKPTPGAVAELRQAFGTLAGFRAMTEPDSRGRILLTFHMNGRTTLAQVLETAATTQTKVFDPPSK
jgi:copper chaperone CopZ